MAEVTQVANASPSAEFDPGFREQLTRLLRTRRDVRHFKRDAVDPVLVESLLAQAMLAPSVGFSQPWRWVLVEDAQLRSAIVTNHELANGEASKLYLGERAAEYRSLKLAGLREAPVHIAVFADGCATTGHGLGRQTMPETVLWSVVMAIYALWLCAAAEGLGVGWVSILDPRLIAATLSVPADWQFVAYLCLGWPEEYASQPLLETKGWESRLETSALIYRR